MFFPQFPPRIAHLHVLTTVRLVPPPTLGKNTTASHAFSSTRGSQSYYSLHGRRRTAPVLPSRTYIPNSRYRTTSCPHALLRHCTAPGQCTAPHRTPPACTYFPYCQLILVMPSMPPLVSRPPARTASSSAARRPAPPLSGTPNCTARGGNRLRHGVQGHLCRAVSRDLGQNPDCQLYLNNFCWRRLHQPRRPGHFWLPCKIELF